MSTTQIEKLALLEWIASLQDQEIIRELIQWKEHHERVSLDQYNRELDEANARIEAGEFTSHDEVVKESGSWLK